MRAGGLLPLTGAALPLPAGIRMLPFVVQAVFQILPPTPTLVSQVALTALTWNLEGYCSTVLLQDPVCQQRQLVLASTMEILSLPAVAAMPVAGHILPAAALSGELLLPPRRAAAELPLAGAQHLLPLGHPPTPVPCRCTPSRRQGACVRSLQDHNGVLAPGAGRSFSHGRLGLHMAAAGVRGARARTSSSSSRACSRAVAAPAAQGARRRCHVRRSAGVAVWAARRMGAAVRCAAVSGHNAVASLQHPRRAGRADAGRRKFCAWHLIFFHAFCD